jgi:hypothetical protein
MTTQRYAHLLDDPLRAATERVGAIIDKAGMSSPGTVPPGKAGLSMRNSASAPQEITPECVARWFAYHFKRRRLALRTCASIAGKIEWIAKYPPPKRLPESQSLAAKHARLLHRHLPKRIANVSKLAQAEDRWTGESGASPYWLTVAGLNNLRSDIERLMPSLDPPRPKRTQWHLQAAWIEDVIRSSVALHEGPPKFSRASDRPLPALIADILEHIGAGTHPHATVAAALVNVPRRERLAVLRVLKAGASIGALGARWCMNTRH